MRFFYVTMFACILVFFVGCSTKDNKEIVEQKKVDKNTSYPIPDTSKIANDKTGKEIRYGMDLFSNTAKYLGPNGSVMQLTGNKMNCRNCHLDQGRRLFANNLIETYLKYPQYRAREGMVLTIEDRINNCFERPMNGKILKTDSREMRAMVAYVRWLSEGHIASYKEDSFHLGAITLIDRAANPEKGGQLFKVKCAKCHGDDGQGRMDSLNIAYLYPPLWGKNSYAAGSSMHRVITASRYIKWAMPFKEYVTDPELTDEEAFDLAAFINNDSIHPRPYRPLKKDCPDLERKPIDFPSGPYLDTFSDLQHKYGPFATIKEFYKKFSK